MMMRRVAPILAALLTVAPTATAIDIHQTGIETEEQHTFWPTVPPTQTKKDCQIVFKDRSMATCHVGAFGGNFGDMIGPDIVKRLVEHHFEGCSSSNIPVVDFERQNVTAGPCLWTVGSVFRNVRKHDHVWGTGSFGKLREYTDDKCTFKQTNITVYSLRGPRSKEMLREHCRGRVRVFDYHYNEKENEKEYSGNVTKLSAAGDAGFLLPMIFPEVGAGFVDTQHGSMKDKKSCLILHKYDEETFTGHENIDGNRILNLPVVQSWQTMAGNISQSCRVVSSSSLHGIILANAYGIPARWIKRNAHILPFKFKDYFESLGSPQGVNETALYDYLQLETILEKSDSLSIPATYTYEQRSAYAKRVLRTFPLHLFTTTTNQATIDPMDHVKSYYPFAPIDRMPGAQADEEDGSAGGGTPQKPALKPHQVDYHMWPQDTPAKLIPSLPDCQVQFRDASMALCYYGAHGGNFGHVIGPDIVRRLLEYKFQCSASGISDADFRKKETLQDGPCLWSVGSVLKQVRPHDHVWGTGSYGNSKEAREGPCRPKNVTAPADESEESVEAFGDEHADKFQNVTIYAVRGPKTGQLLSRNCEHKIQIYDGYKLETDLTRGFPDGDAGFLVPFVFPELRRNSTLTVGRPDIDNCVILHYTDQDDFDTGTFLSKHEEKLDPSITYLKAVQPWKDMAASISQCQSVSTSSLHGMMVADAYGVPVRWIRHLSSVSKFKFDDYFESIDHKRKMRSVEDVLLNPDFPKGIPIETNLRTDYAQKIVETFPFHLFETRAIA